MEGEGSGASQRQIAGRRAYAESPIFLVGSERSGTTLLRLMLDHHPEIAFNLESEFLVTHISDSGVFPEVVDYRHKLQEDRVFRHSRFDIDDTLDFPSLVNDFLRQKRERDDKKFVGATVHYQFHKIRFLWPRARYIYLLRDGRDVAASVAQMGWTGNAYVGADWWLAAEREWTQVRKELDPAQWIEVRYEDLTVDTPGQLRNICNFIGVAYSEAMCDYVRTSTYESPDPKDNYKWRRLMRRRELRQVEARIGTHLVERGYELSAVQPLHISRLQDRWLRALSRAGTVRYRVSKFGLRLTATESLARRLGWPRLQASARRAIDGIIDQNLK